MENNKKATIVVATGQLIKTNFFYNLSLQTVKILNRSKDGLQRSEGWERWAKEEKGKEESEWKAKGEEAHDQFWGQQ